MVIKVKKHAPFDAASALSAPGALAVEPERPENGSEKPEKRRNSSRTTPKTYSVRNDLLTALEALRVRRGERSTSRIVNEALEMYLQKYNL